MFGLWTTQLAGSEANLLAERVRSQQIGTVCSTVDTCRLHVQIVQPTCVKQRRKAVPQPASLRRATIAAWDRWPDAFLTCDSRMSKPAAISSPLRSSTGHRYAGATA